MASKKKTTPTRRPRKAKFTPWNSPEVPVQLRRVLAKLVNDWSFVVNATEGTERYKRSTAMARSLKAILVADALDDDVFLHGLAKQCAPYLKRHADTELPAPAWGGDVVETRTEHLDLLREYVTDYMERGVRREVMAQYFVMFVLSRCSELRASLVLAGLDPNPRSWRVPSELISKVSKAFKPTISDPESLVRAGLQALGLREHRNLFSYRVQRVRRGRSTS